MFYYYEYMQEQINLAVNRLKEGNLTRAGTEYWKQKISDCTNKMIEMSIEEAEVQIEHF